MTTFTIKAALLIFNISIADKDLNVSGCLPRQKKINTMTKTDIPVRNRILPDGPFLEVRTEKSS